MIKLKKLLGLKPPKPNFIVNIKKSWLEELEESAILYEQEESDLNQENLKRSKYKNKKEIGIIGENIVSNSLLNLSNEYIVFNNLNLLADDWILYKGKKNLKSAQIDHLVLGPTGIFIIETKFWSKDFLDNNKFTPSEQIKRSEKLLIYLLKEHYILFNNFQIKKIVISISDTIKNVDPGIKLLRANQVSSFISNSSNKYSQNEIKKLHSFFRNL